MPGLIVWNGRVPVNYLELKDPRTLIGRDRSNDIVLASTSASHFHATLVREAGGYRVLNHGLNGTYVNDVLVPPRGTLLGHEDVIRFADTEFTFYIDAPIDGPTGNLVLPEHLRPVAAASRREHDLSGLVGDAPAMHVVGDRIMAWGPTDNTVLVIGETGTGKELVATALHRSSPRARSKMVTLNAAAVSRDLVASELFGHKRGSFTGAMANRIGYFEQAHQSTLFIDEIGDASPELQVALLRAIQQKEITRVGESHPRKVNVRIIAATNKNLPAACEEGTFRHDLYFRLSPCTIVLPSLAERREDIPRLVMHFLQLHGGGRTITSDALALLQDHDWPGNVRELEGAILSAIPYARDTLEPRHFGHMHWAERVALLFDRVGLWELYVKLNYSKRKLAETLKRSRYEIDTAMRNLGLETVRNPGGRRKKVDPDVEE